MSRRSAISLAVVVLLLGSGWATLRYRTTGVDMTRAAEVFVSTLDDRQRQIALLPYDTPQRTDWHFIPKEARKGLQVRDMTDEQRAAAHRLLQTALSQAGYSKAQQIMSLEDILHTLEGEQARFKRDPLRYYFTIFGQPDTGARWGLSVEGHHLSLNFVVTNGQVASHTPAFFGANPAIVRSDLSVGPPRGTRVLAQEEVLAFELLHSLNDEQRAAAVIDDTAPADLRGGGDPQPPHEQAEGIAAERFSPQQQKLLRALLTAYTENMPDEVAARNWSQIEQAGLEHIHFAWAGADQPGIGHYYRIQGPTFLVELVNTQPDSAGNPANHIHSVWRNLSGDFDIPLKNHLHDDHD